MFMLSCSSLCACRENESSPVIKEYTSDKCRLLRVFVGLTMLQTPAHPPAEAGTMTQPPPTADAGGSCSPWHMHDAYMADLERQKAAEEAAKVRSAAARKRADTAAENEEEVDAAAQVGRALLFLYWVAGMA